MNANIAFDQKKNGIWSNFWMDGSTSFSSLMVTPLVILNEKLEKFTNVDFKQWQKKVYLYLTTMNLVKFLLEVYLIINPNEQDVMTIEAWKHMDFLC